MRKIGSIQDKQKREICLFYLFYHGVESQENPGDPNVWVIRDEDRHKATDLFEVFQRIVVEGESGTPEFQKAMEEANLGKKNFLEAKKRILEKEKKWKAIDLRQASSSGFQIFSGTGILILSCVIVFLVSLGPAKETLYRTLMISQVPAFNYFGIPYLYEVGEGQIWRLVTPIFLHFDIFHIFFNMMWLYQLGTVIEKRDGTKFFLLFVFSIGVLSNVLFYFVSRPFFGGMSGVIYSFVGFFWGYSRVNPTHPYSLEQGPVRFFVFWYIFCLLATIFGFRIANSIHGSGALLGVVAGFLRAYQIEKERLPLKRVFSQETLSILVAMVILLALGIYVD